MKKLFVLFILCLCCNSLFAYYLPFIPEKAEPEWFFAVIEHTLSAHKKGREYFVIKSLEDKSMPYDVGRIVSILETELMALSDEKLEDQKKRSYYSCYYDLTTDCLYELYIYVNNFYDVEERRAAHKSSFECTVDSIICLHSAITSTVVLKTEEYSKSVRLHPAYEREDAVYNVRFHD